MRLLVTRPAADAERTAAALRHRGHTAVIAPLLSIATLPKAELGTGPWAAILITSANAVQAIAAHRRGDELRGIAVFAVGERTAQAMRDQGFADVSAGGGNVGDLAALVAARLRPPARLLYLAGEERSGDLAGMLSTRGFVVDTVLVYRAVVAETLPEQAAAALARRPGHQPLGGVLHFSRRSAEAFVAAARQAGLLEPALEGPVHFCLSARVAEPLRQAGATKIRLAARPDEPALLDLCG